MEDKLPLSHLERGSFNNRETIAVICDCGDPDCGKTRVYYTSKFANQLLRRQSSSEDTLPTMFAFAASLGQIEECVEQTDSLTAVLLELTPEEYHIHKVVRSVQHLLDKLEHKLAGIVSDMVSIESMLSKIDPSPDSEPTENDLDEAIKSAPPELKEVFEALRNLRNNS